MPLRRIKQQAIQSTDILRYNRAFLLSLHPIAQHSSITVGKSSSHRLLAHDTFTNYYIYIVLMLSMGMIPVLPLSLLVCNLSCFHPLRGMFWLQVVLTLHMFEILLAWALALFVSPIFDRAAMPTDDAFN